MALKLKDIETPKKLSEVAYEAIKKAILSAEFGSKPEIQVDEDLLAKQLGISRTPVREAVFRLTTEGFLKKIPRRGVYIAKKSPDEIIEILLVRSALEGLAARLAAEQVTKKDLAEMKSIFKSFHRFNRKEIIREYSKANVKFHEYVIERSNCDKLIDIAGNLFSQMQMIRRWYPGTATTCQNSLSEHLAIIEAIGKRNGEVAETLMRKHILSIRERIGNGAR